MIASIGSIRHKGSCRHYKKSKWEKLVFIKFFLFLLFSLLHHLQNGTSYNHAARHIRRKYIGLPDTSTMSRVSCCTVDGTSTQSSTGISEFQTWTRVRKRWFENFGISIIRAQIEAKPELSYSNQQSNHIALDPRQEEKKSALAPQILSHLTSHAAQWYGPSNKKKRVQISLSHPLVRD